MKIKVCGMKHPENINQLAALAIDYMGLIFYPKSPRYIGNLAAHALNVLPKNIERVGVFVNEDLPTVLQQVKKYGLNKIQLHGNESPEYCLECCNQSNVEIIKAFSIATENDFEQTIAYSNVCNYFLFDTKTEQYGGSGQKFDWRILASYTNNTPFFLSGGITANDSETISNISHQKLFAIDINSGFEIEPGLKNIELINTFITKIKYDEQNNTTL